MPRAEVVKLHTTKDLRITYYGIKVGDKFGSDRNGNPISSRNYRYVSDLVWKYNRRIDLAN